MKVRRRDIASAQTKHFARSVAVQRVMLSLMETQTILVASHASFQKKESVQKTQTVLVAPHAKMNVE